MPLNIWPAGWGGRNRQQQSGVSNIPNVLKGQQVLIPTGYGTSATNQSESSKYLALAGAGYEEIYTVPAGKTWYVTGIIIAPTVPGTIILLATGAGGAEVDFAGFNPATGTSTMALTTPIKFTTGTRVSGKDAAGSSHISLIGWEE